MDFNCRVILTPRQCSVDSVFYAGLAHPDPFNEIKGEIAVGKKFCLFALFDIWVAEIPGSDGIPVQLAKTVGL